MTGFTTAHDEEKVILADPGMQCESCKKHRAK